ncbi:MAG: hypothetical protein IJC73_07225 [Lentisphaeria bacterium]|nr:hypothetical protein [Lentisphaeria bacterium]
MKNSSAVHLSYNHRFFDKTGIFLLPVLLFPVFLLLSGILPGNAATAVPAPGTAAGECLVQEILPDDPDHAPGSFYHTRITRAPVHKRPVSRRQYRHCPLSATAEISRIKQVISAEKATFFRCFQQSHHRSSPPRYTPFVRAGPGIPDGVIG